MTSLYSHDIFWFYFSGLSNRIMREIFSHWRLQPVYNKTCVTSKDSDQPVHPPSKARVLVYLSLDSLEAVEGTVKPVLSSHPWEV